MIAGPPLTIFPIANPVWQLNPKVLAFSNSRAERRLWSSISLMR
jgi:hypothetical protein